MGNSVMVVAPNGHFLYMKNPTAQYVYNMHKAAACSYFEDAHKLGLYSSLKDFFDAQPQYFTVSSIHKILKAMGEDFHLDFIAQLWVGATDDRAAYALSIGAHECAPAVDGDVGNGEG